MKKVLAALSALSLVASITPVQAAVKTGNKCTILGQKKTASGKEFICIKSGKKLEWKRSVVASKFEPWSTPLNQGQALMAFRKNIDQWFNSRETQTADLEIYVDPAINPSGIPWITDALTFQASYMGLPSPAKYKVYIGKTDKWVISKRKKVMPGLETWDPKYVCYQDLNQGCASPASREVQFVWSTSKLSSPTENWEFTRALGHEFFHITQCDLTGSPENCGDYFNTVPSWLAEGGPNAIGAIFMDRLGYLKYEVQRKTALAQYKNGKLGGNYPLASFSQNIRFGDLNPYEIGMLASEYLIASAGLQAFFDFHSNLPKAKNFEEAFQQSFGISLSEFYAAFDKARVNLGFYPVTKK